MPKDNQHDPDHSSFSWEGVLGVLHDVLEIKGETNESAEAIAKFLATRPNLSERIVERLRLYFREGSENDGLIHFRALFNWGLICRTFRMSDGQWFAHTYQEELYGSSQYLNRVGNGFPDYDTAKEACLNHLKAIGYFRIHSDRKKKEES